MVSGVETGVGFAN